MAIIFAEVNARINPDFWPATGRVSGQPGHPRSQIPNPGLAAPGEMRVSKPQTRYKEARPNCAQRPSSGFGKAEANAYSLPPHGCRKGEHPIF